MSRSANGFTLVEILVGLSLSAAIFLVATSLVVNVFNSNLKSKHKELLAQVKNDLSAEFGNSVRWAESLNYANNFLSVDSAEYRLQEGRIYRNSLPITPEEVEVTKFSLRGFQSPLSQSSSGSGILAKYFDNSDFTSEIFTQIVPNVDFDWGINSPDQRIDPDTFSIRFTGQFETNYDGEHFFYLASDDGARLWINDELVVNDWSSVGFGEKTGRKYLNKGRHNIRLDYYEKTGNAQVKLFWSYSGKNKEIIPASNFCQKLGAVSIKIDIEMKIKNNPSINDNLSLFLSLRGGGY